MPLKEVNNHSVNQGRLLSAGPFLMAFIGIIAFCGCAAVSSQPQINRKSDIPVAISISPFTEIRIIDNYNAYAAIAAYVDLIDTAGNNIKYPGVFRFGLYEYKILSANSQGKMLYSWPAIDTSAHERDNGHWNEAMRSYMFNLEMDGKLDESEKYVLSVTFSAPRQQLRFTDKRIIQ
jgi:hypothetical protein